MATVETAPDTAHPMSANELDNMHAAFFAGCDYGRAERFTAEVADAVSAALHTQACEMNGWAQRLAMSKGPAWAEMIREGDDRE